jgi:hypothetical protein|tara:strand:- start:320 stop:625 length:306 start_codon:yes stop_codon:yes gene_type:complete
MTIGTITSLLDKFTQELEAKALGPNPVTLGTVVKVIEPTSEDPRFLNSLIDNRTLYGPQLVTYETFSGELVTTLPPIITLNIEGFTIDDYIKYKPGDSYPK